MKILLKKGFTLIELLVVIAIIGLLSAVVLASLNSARTKGRISAAKAALVQFRSQAALYYDGTGNNTYGTALTTNGTCPAAVSGSGGLFADAAIFSIRANAMTNATSQACYNITSGAGNGGYAYSVTLPDSTNWCVDSTGLVKASTASATGC